MRLERQSQGYFDYTQAKNRVKLRMRQAKDKRKRGKKKEMGCKRVESNLQSHWEQERKTHRGCDEDRMRSWTSGFERLSTLRKMRNNKNKKHKTKDKHKMKLWCNLSLLGANWVVNTHYKSQSVLQSRLTFHSCLILTYPGGDQEFVVRGFLHKLKEMYLLLSRIIINHTISGIGDF